MARGIYIGESNQAKKIKNFYVGVNGQARKVVKAYVGVSGVAKQFWPAGVEFTYIMNGGRLGVNGTDYLLSGDPCGNWVLELYGSGTLTFTSLPTNIDIHCVGGGGGGTTGWRSLGGGGGYTKFIKNYTPTTNIFYCEVGAGGSPGETSGSGGPSFVKLNNNSGSDVIRAGGGQGATHGDWKTAGNGGSGGGAWGGTGGSNGGNGNTISGSNSYPGSGQGSTTRDFGESTGTLRAGGGGGGDANGGDGGGGAYSSSGTDHYGGGGGGDAGGGHSGGSGIVIIRNARG